MNKSKTLICVHSFDGTGCVEPAFNGGANGWLCKGHYQQLGANIQQGRGFSRYRPAPETEVHIASILVAEKRAIERAQKTYAFVERGAILNKLVYLT